jgi:hypothetical protein
MEQDVLVKYMKWQIKDRLLYKLNKTGNSEFYSSCSDKFYNIKIMPPLQIRHVLMSKSPLNFVLNYRHDNFITVIPKFSRPFNVAF